MVVPLSPDLLTRLRNASMAKLRQISVPYSKGNLSILAILLQHGLISSVSKGTISTPDAPTSFLTASLPSRRLWVTLKYSATDRPVLSTLELVSKPSKKIFMDREQLLRWSTYRRSQWVNPLNLGEIGIVNCGKDGWYEAREAVRRGIKGGEVVARAG